MYKVFPVEGGHSIFWLASPEAEPVLIPHLDKGGKQVPYSKRQAAYRRCKQLNDATRKVDEMAAKDGAIIL